jgi:hypothetical protein
MRRTSSLAKVAVAAALTLTALLPHAGVAASPPERVTVNLSESSTDDFLTEACGTEVVFTFTGTVEYTLWRNDEGLVERELDRFPGAFITWSAPETGQSVKTGVNLVSRWDYGDGAVLGGPVTVAFHGLFFHLPGATSAWAGREVSEGDVDGFENGVPIVDDVTLVSFVGHVLEDFDFVEAVCGALT